MSEYFSVRDSLLELKKKNYDVNITKTIDLLVENYDEDQIRMLSQKGLNIDNNIIRLFFMENVGFRCLNEQVSFYGKLPVCNNIEKYMNKLYLDSYSE